MASRVCSVTIENFPDYAKTKPYIVARYDEHTEKFWFYGAWESETDAKKVVTELGSSAFVFINNLV